MSRTFLSVAISLLCITSGTLRAQQSQDSYKPDLHATLDDGKFKPPKPHGEIYSLIRYPEEAKRTNKEGKVTLALLIDEHGIAEKTLVKSVSDSVFITPTLDAVKHLTFSPATHAGTPVKSWLTMPVFFKIKREKKERP